MTIRELRAVLRRPKLPVPMLESVLICAGLLALFVFG